MSVTEVVQTMRVHGGLFWNIFPAVQLGLTATPKRTETTDTYDYFEIQYQLFFKEGINDGFLTPFKKGNWTP